MRDLNDLILLADKDSNAWDFSEKIQKNISERWGFKIPLKNASIRPFPAGEIDMYVPESVRKKNVYFIHDSTKNPQEWWVELLLIQNLLLSNSAESVSLVLPNLLYSRQDRRDKPHVPISARALADSFSHNLKRILTLDLHSPQIQGFYPPEVPLENLYSFPEVINHLRTNHTIDNLENLVFVSPDAGGVTRVEAFSNKLKSKYPIAFIAKKRNNNGNRDIKKMTLVGEVYDKDVLIIDDMIDSGGTLCKAASLLKENGAKKLYCYGTHGLLTSGTEELSKYFEKIMISNTHNNPSFLDNEKIEVIDVSGIFANAIYNIENGLSLSEIFK